MTTWCSARSLVATCMLLHGCGGTGFELPPVSDAEAFQAAQAIDAVPRLPRYERSNAYYRQAIRRIAPQLVRDVGPVCQRAETAVCQFRFHYVADDEVNAFTEDDGHIYLHRGMLDYLQSDEEIAAVMAHEMGHHIAGHVDESKGSVILGALLGGLVMGGAAVAGGLTQEEANQQTNQGMGLGARIGQISFSKEQEREADLLAAYVLARGGFDLQRAGGTFDVLAKLDDRTNASWKDTHPAGPERIVAWHKAVAEVEASDDGLPRLLAP